MPKRGWGGLLWYNPDDPETHKFVMPLDKQRVRTVRRLADRIGDTISGVPGTANAARLQPSGSALWMPCFAFTLDSSATPERS